MWSGPWLLLRSHFLSTLPLVYYAPIILAFFLLPQHAKFIFISGSLQFPLPGMPTPSQMHGWFLFIIHVLSYLRRSFLAILCRGAPPSSSIRWPCFTFFMKSSLLEIILSVHSYAAFLPCEDVSCTEAGLLHLEPSKPPEPSMGPGILGHSELFVRWYARQWIVSWFSSWVMLRG